MHDGMEELFDVGDSALEAKRKRKEYAQSVERSFADTFGSANGKVALQHLRAHLLGTAVLDRGAESNNETIRRDALRDVYFWIERLTLRGAKQEIAHG